MPCGPINTIAEVFEEPQAKARGLLNPALQHASGGTVPGVASPLRFSKTPVDDTVAPPVLGQHTREILAGVLGLDEDAIGTLLADGTVEST